MALSTGIRLGPYEVLALIGTGGMGEVYRARDPRLERDVAIKVLAPQLAQDRDALARFEREAKMASALNHPHIVHIYEIGEANTPAGLVHYIAMELVEGETLRARLRAGTSMQALLEPLAQVADALARAHKAGIVHRDLKPENVMISPDGYPKVLDFGLAKLHDPPSGESQATPAFAGHTRTGTVLGTPGYMSPEQVQGKPADQRSDVFSFGCILYEAATGRQPFRGETSVATLHAIVYDEPPGLESLSPNTPEPLRRIIRRCLEKSPEQRFQGMKDVADGLRALARGHTTPDPEMIPTAVLTGASSRPGALWSRWHWLAAGGLAIAVIGGLMVSRMQESRKSDASSAPRAAIQIEKLTSRGDVSRPTVSPDGRYLAYTTSETPLAIWLRDLVEKTEARLVTLPAAEYLVRITFARDGRSIYYEVVEKNTTNNSLYRKALIGGEPRPVPLGTLSPDERRIAFTRPRDGKWILVVAELEDSTEKEVGEVDRGSVLGWSPDGSQLMFSRLKDAKHTVSVVKSDGTGERKVSELAQAIERAWWKPDASAAVLSVSAAARRDDKRVQLIDLDLASGATRPLGKGTWKRLVLSSVRWLPDNSGIVFTAETERPEIWQVSYPNGEAKRVSAGTASYADLGMTADGTKLVALQTSERSDLLVSSNPEAGIYKKLVSGTDVKYSLCWTPDGQIVYASNEAGSSDLYVSDPDGARRKQLTFDRKANEIAPAASPDGRYVVFASDRTGRLGIQRINADGTGLLSLTSPTAGYDSNPYVTPDSRWVFYQGWDNGPTLWKLPIDGGTPTLVAGKRSDAREEKAFGVSASPDGTSLAFFYLTLDRRRREFSPTRIAISTMEGRILRELPYVSPLTGVGDYQRVQWSRDGSTLYYHQVGRPDNLWKRPVAGGSPVQVTHFEDRLVDFEWSKDGKLLACSRQSRVSDAVLITNFR